MAINKLILTVTLCVLADTSLAFEIDGFKSGMSMAEAKSVAIGMGFDAIGGQGSTILLSDDASRTNPRLYSLIFCAGRLSLLQKHPNSKFSTFVRLVSEEAHRRGQPTYAWAKPSDPTSNIEENDISFAWKRGREYFIAKFTEFPSNNSVTITYEVKNSCWEPPI